jgi:hypothetical protein
VGIDNIYKDLEKIWTDYKQEFSVIKDGMLPLILGGPLLLLVGGVGKYQNRIKEKWEQYIQKTIDYAGTLNDVEPENEAK